MIIHVTKEHIDDGERGQCAFCPVALAIREINPRVKVGTRHLIFPNGRLVRLPGVVRDFIDDFDTEGQVQPFSFFMSAECFMEAKL